MTEDGWDDCRRSDRGAKATQPLSIVKSFLALKLTRNAAVHFLNAGISRNHVQPRSRKKINRTGTGTPISQRRIQPILPDFMAQRSPPRLGSVFVFIMLCPLGLQDSSQGTCHASSCHETLMEYGISDFSTVLIKMQKANPEKFHRRFAQFLSTCSRLTRFHSLPR